MPEPLSAQSKSELVVALDETIDTISEHCLLRIHGKTMEARVMQSAKQAWRDHYTASYKEAIEKKKRHWKHDREQVLERASGRVSVGLLRGAAVGLRRAAPRRRSARSGRAGGAGAGHLARAGLPAAGGQPHRHECGMLHRLRHEAAAHGDGAIHLVPRADTRHGARSHGDRAAAANAEKRSRARESAHRKGPAVEALTP
jgi:hypothetical protein